MHDDCVVEDNCPPFCVNPLSVVEGRRLRLVKDLRHVHKYVIRNNKFKYKDLWPLSQVLLEGSWFFNWDLKSRYHHVDIHEDHQRYLGFSWRFNGVIRYFTFSVLPFGLSAARF